MDCNLRNKTDKYSKYINSLVDIDNKGICSYKTYDTFYDEYLFFISASKYNQIDEIVNNSEEEKNIVCSYRVSGKYDFIVKAFYPRNNSSFSTFLSTSKKAIKNIQKFKVIDRFAFRKSRLVKVFETSDNFYNLDVELPEFYMFADFIEIKAIKGQKLTSDLINALNKGNLKHIYVVYKLKNIENNTCIWLVCLRYKCYEYNQRKESQGVLDTFVDARKHIKTTYISNSSNIRKENIKKLFENMRYENIIGNVLYADSIRGKICKIHKSLTNVQDFNKYLDTLRTKYCKFYNELLSRVRGYEFYFSYKQGDKLKNISTQICDYLFSWFCINEFEKIYRAEECISCGDNIIEFMEKLGKSDLVVFCLSDKFFQAFNCMYELSLVAQNNKNTRNFIKEKMIFITPEFFLLPNRRNEIKEYWKKELLQDQNNIEGDKAAIVINNINFIDKIANVQQIRLKDDEPDSEVLHYEKAIEAILTNIVEKVLKEYTNNIN